MRKSKTLCFGWMQEMEKRFGISDATHLLHDISIDTSINERRKYTIKSKIYVSIACKT